MNLAKQKIVFVTGKGGVGKSLSAASIAWREARKGKKVCLVELGEQSFYENFFETRGIGHDPSEVISDIHIALLGAEDCLREYILHFIKIPKLYDVLFQNKIMKAFMNAAPAISELSILGKLTADQRGILEKEYDLYVVDCYSTGHALAFLRAPQGLADTIRSGPLFSQTRDIAKILKNPELVHYVLVTLPEEMPVAETEELAEKIKNEFHDGITVVCNKVFSPPLNKNERAELVKATHDSGMSEFINYVDFKEVTQGEHVKRAQKLSPLFYKVPLILQATSGLESVQIFSQYLESPWTSTNS